jgi:hypothetical protein
MKPSYIIADQATSGETLSFAIREVKNTVALPSGVSRFVWASILTRNMSWPSLERVMRLNSGSPAWSVDEAGILQDLALSRLEQGVQSAYDRHWEDEISVLTTHVDVAKHIIKQYPR